MGYKLTINEIVKSQKGDKDSTLKLIEKFTPLIKKYEYKLNYEDAYNDLIMDFIESIHNIHVEKMKSKGEGSTLRTLIIMFYLANEGISILENAGQLGLAIPQKLKEAIQKLSSDEQ